MLYPEERKEDRTLWLACRNCGFKKSAKSGLVYFNAAKKMSQRRLDLVDPDICFDPTVSKNKTVNCGHCGAGEAVFFMGPSTGKDADMALIFLCTACKHKWMENE